jgi:hypothetical protein
MTGQNQPWKIDKQKELGQLAELSSVVGRVR